MVSMTLQSAGLNVVEAIKGADGYVKATFTVGTGTPASLWAS